MSYAKSFYAEAKSDVESVASPAQKPSTTQGEVNLSPAQLQEAIRFYRQLNQGQLSAPQLQECEEPERTPVNSSYVDQSGVPQSYNVGYTMTPQKPRNPLQQNFAPFNPQELMAQLQAMSFQKNDASSVPQKSTQEKPAEEPPLPASQEKQIQRGFEKETRYVQPERPRIAVSESGYMFDCSKEKDKARSHEYSAHASISSSNTNAKDFDGAYNKTAPIAESSLSQGPPYRQINPSSTHEPRSGASYKKMTSEYIGMPNENVFFMDVQKNPSYGVTYVTNTVAPSANSIHQEVKGEHSTEQAPISSIPQTPQSRFRGLIRDISSSEAPVAPIIIQHVESSPADTYATNNYGAFRSAMQDVPSEYQMHQLNDLTSSSRKKSRSAFSPACLFSAVHVSQLAKIWFYIFIFVAGSFLLSLFFMCDKEASSSRSEYKEDSKMEKLAKAENRIFANFGIKFLSRFIPVSFKNSVVYTVSVKPEEMERKIEPVVLVHGFGAGVALWGAAIKHLSKNHTVHAFDLLGFGRSSRPTFSKDASTAEAELVQSIEDWRQEMEIEKMFLVAHSFGGYLASAYAIKYPQRVKHLILADPWGFSEKTTDFEQKLRRRTRFLISLLSNFNPLAVLRLSGPYGPQLMKKVRPDLQYRYPSENPDDIYEYIYRCNARKPTGEAAFKSMILPFAWARNPMIRRFQEVDESVPVTFIHGANSWIDPSPAHEILKQRQAGYVDVQIMEHAGHHVYADDTLRFVQIVRDAIDQKKPQNFTGPSLGNPLYS
ncbi:unnamed protein product [Caenorhabditis auriculariae]|uniref:AB hydrolase-1 domain-containing protein n=1 Tax=Caenorhabditis auriculariae TaxID=2777116 RepID=A0A8S1HGH4_9PELO|nr:unnamed protein product [Caenorhabditis auriculariae]